MRVDAATARKHEADALALRLAHPKMSYEEIAERVGLGSASAAHSAVMRPLRAQIADNAKDLQAIKIGQLDAALEAIWPNVLEGDYKAIDRATVLIRQQVDILGLKHSDAIAERAQALEEGKAMMLAHAIRAILDELGLTPDQREREQEIVQKQLQLIAGKDDKDNNE